MSIKTRRVGANAADEVQAVVRHKQTIEVTRPRKRRWATLVTAASLALGGGCADAGGAASENVTADLSDDVDAGGELASTTQALFGTPEPDSCTPDQSRWLRNVMVAGRIVASSNAFAQCMDATMRRETEFAETTYGPYQSCAGNLPLDPAGNFPLADKIAVAIELSRNPRNIELRCIDTTTAPNADVGSATPNWEYVRVRVPGVPPFKTATFATYASGPTGAHIVWHEAMHSLGYNHNPSTGGNPCKQDSFHNSLPYIVQGCMDFVGEKSQEQCGHTSCGSGRAAIVSSFPVSSSTGCTCVRDTEEHAPRLGTNDRDDLYGQAVAAADFNGDGFVDLAVGAPGDNSGEGSVYIYEGSKFGFYPARRLPVNRTGIQGHRIGTALAAADFDGNGMSELFIGAPGANSGAGGVYVYRGTPKGPQEIYVALSQGWVDVDEAAGDGFGTSLAVGRFFDGTLALAVGIPRKSVSGVKSGMVALFGYVNGDDLIKPWGTIVKSAPRTNNDLFGSSLAFGRLKTGIFPNVVLGEHMVIGSPGVNQVHVVDPRVFGSGTSMITAQPNYFIQGPAGSLTPAGFGASVVVEAGLSDSSRNIVVGAPYHGEGDAYFRGAVYVYKDERSSTSSSNYSLVTKWLGSTASGLFGMSLAKHEGQVLIGAPGIAGGRVYRKDRVYENGVHVTKNISVRTQPGLDEAGDWWGMSLAVGDFDADGTDDYASGAPGESPGSDPKAGAVYSLWWDIAAQSYVARSTMVQDD